MIADVILHIGHKQKQQNEMKKPISTEQTDSNIREVMRLLKDAPGKLEALSEELSDVQLRTPLAPGERSFTEILAHILNCDAITSQAIYLALLTHEPLLPNIHPERDLGKLVRLELMPFDELLAYFKFRRTILLHVLNTLTESKWSRVVREENKQRKESVYWQVRGQALHELEHLQEIEARI